MFSAFLVLAFYVFAFELLAFAFSAFSLSAVFFLAWSIRNHRGNYLGSNSPSLILRLVGSRLALPLGCQDAF
jgi:hypothetical protein